MKGLEGGESGVEAVAHHRRRWSSFEKQRRTRTMAAVNIGGRGKEPANGSNKRAKKSGMPPNVGNWDEAASPTQFYKVLVAPALGLLPIPDAFRPYLDSVPDTVTLKLTTGCQWDITISDVNGKACFNQGWAAVSVAHDLKIGYLLTFKKIYPKGLQGGHL